ncbi:MAG: hypothetical protein R3C32_10685 [Chloroflexota bacterium]
MDGRSIPATSIVPAGIELRGEGDFRPTFDPDAARAASPRPLPRWRRLPIGHVRDLRHPVRCGLSRPSSSVSWVAIASEVMPFGEFTTRLEEDPPQMWQPGWAAVRIPKTSWGCSWRPAAPTTWVAGATRRSTRSWTRPPPRTTRRSRRPTTRRRSIVADQVPGASCRLSGGLALSRVGLSGAADAGLGSSGTRARMAPETYRSQRRAEWVMRIVLVLVVLALVASLVLTIGGTRSRAASDAALAHLAPVAAGPAGTASRSCSASPARPAA